MNPKQLSSDGGPMKTYIQMYQVGKRAEKFIQLHGSLLRLAIQ